MAALVKFFKSRLDYLELNREMKPDADHLPMQKQTTQSMILCVQRVKTIQVETATELMVMLRDTKLLQEEHIQALLCEIESRLAMDEAVIAMAPDGATNLDSPSHMGKMQKLFSIRMFFWASIWTIIMNVDIPYSSVMKQLAFFCRKIGLNNPNERTCQYVCATVYATRLSISRTELPPHDRLTYLRMFKAYLRSFPLSYDGPKEYPDSPVELQRVFPGLYAAVYAAEEPDLPKVSEESVVAELCMTPCRTTRLGMAAPQANSGRSWTNLPRRSFAHVMEALAVQSAPGLADFEIPGLKIFERSHCADNNGPLPLGWVQQQQQSPEQVQQPRLPANIELKLLEPIAPDQKAQAQRTEPPLAAIANVDNMMHHMLQQAAKTLKRTQQPGCKTPQPKARTNCTSTRKKPQPKARMHDAPKAKGKANGKSKGKKSAAPPKTGLVLGCSRCRWSPKGCDDYKGCRGCRNPLFGGKRRKVKGGN